jgi:NitT/TauT family transport system substrate-binding protein
MRVSRVMSRRSLLGEAAMIAACLTAPSLRAQGRPEKSKIVIAVGGKTAFSHLPLTISEQLGYFKAEGIELEISDVSGGARAMQAMVGGVADVGAGAFEHTIHLQSKNQLFQAFVLQGRAPQVAFGVSMRALPEYKTIADLRGKKIGLASPGASTNMIANLVLARGGLRPSEVNFIEVGGSSSGLAALRSNQIDAICNTDPVMTMLEQKGDVKIIGDTRTLKGTLEVFGGPMPSACLYAPVEFVQKNPNTCQALANAMVRGLKWLQTAGPGDIIKTVPESYLLGDRALYLASFNKVRESISPDGLLPEDGARTALKALAGFDPLIRPEKIDLAKTYTNEFARRAKARFQA